MYERILRRFRKQVRRGEYVMTVHAEEEMAEEGYTILDVEEGIRTGTILERQQDRTTAERKYRLRGFTASGEEIEIVAKLGPAGKMVINTVFAP